MDSMNNVTVMSASNSKMASLFFTSTNVGVPPFVVFNDDYGTYNDSVYTGFD